jgi:hypothetical protein
MKMKNKIIISRYCLICFLLLIFCNGCGQSSDIKPGTESFPEENPTNTPTAESTPTETPDPMLNMFVEHLLEGDFDKVSGLYVFDIDGDGDQDIIGAAMGDREIAWWRNDGGNPVSWVKQVIAENLVGAAYVHAEDVDGDLDGDVVAGAGSEIYWWRNEGGDPIVWTRITVAENLSESHAAVFADIDNDGDFDVLGSSAAQNKLFWMENTSPAGDGQVWMEHSISDDFLYVQSIFAADLDADGDLDVLATSLNSFEVAWWRNEGGNPINWTMTTIDDFFSYAHWVFVTDLDQDGRLDILGAAYRGENQSSSLAWWHNEGGDPLVFTKQVIEASFKGALTIHAADLDLDGDMDVLATANDLGQVAWWRNEGGYPITWTKYIIHPYFSGAWPVYTGDFDGDGDIDVVAGADRLDDIYWWENMAVDFSP